jgi:dihydropteroate synthase
LISVIVTHGQDLHSPVVLPLVMGVLNVTPDSFSDGGRWLDHEAAVGHGRRLIADGADVVDVGGESTRPGAAPVEPSVEIDRVIPVIEALRGQVRISVDTRRAEVAVAAAQAGADLLNDVSASLHEVAADQQMGWIAMHMQGDPTTMQDAPRYDDVVAEVAEFLTERASAAEAAGVDEVWVDPGIGFGKSFADNWRLLAHLDTLVDVGLPVVVGTSRKGFLGEVTGRSDGRDTPTPADDRLEASVATAIHAMTMGARMVRAHDVRDTASAARVFADAIGARAA